MKTNKAGQGRQNQSPFTEAVDAVSNEAAQLGHDNATDKPKKPSRRKSAKKASSTPPVRRVEVSDATLAKGIELARGVALSQAGSIDERGLKAYALSLIVLQYDGSVLVCNSPHHAQLMRGQQTA